jgi:hypothetical protein
MMIKQHFICNADSDFAAAAAAVVHAADGPDAAHAA